MKVGLIIDELAPGSTPKLIGWPIKELAKIGVDAEAIVMIEKDHWQKHKEFYDFHLGGTKIRYLFPKYPWLFKKFNFNFIAHNFINSLRNWKSLQLPAAPQQPATYSYLPILHS